MLDCIDIFTHDDDPDHYYGVYHRIIDDIDDYRLFIVRSKDLKSWERVTVIDDYASQGKVWIDETTNDILLAYEKSDNGDYVQINHYNSLRDFLALNHDKIFTMPRSLSVHAEGTPSFKNVFKQGKNITNSEIHLRMHFF